MTSYWGRRVLFTAVAVPLAVLLVSATPLAAQDISINLGQTTAAGGLNERIIHLIALLTALSLAPSSPCRAPRATRSGLKLSRAIAHFALSGKGHRPPRRRVVLIADRWIGKVLERRVRTIHHHFSDRTQHAAGDVLRRSRIFRQADIEHAFRFRIHSRAM